MKPEKKNNYVPLSTYVIGDIPQENRKMVLSLLR